MQELKRFFIASYCVFLLTSVVSAETTVRIGVPGALTASIPIYIGRKVGIFAKHGLFAEPILTRNEQMNTQALVSGSVHYSISSPTGLFYLARQGGDVVGIASWNNSSPYSLGTGFKIKDLKELKGRKIASSGAGGRADAFIRFMLTKVGLDPKRDAQIVSLSGGSGVRLAAVVSGNIDATLISSAQEKHAEKLGLTVIPIPMEYIQGVVVTQRTYLEKNRGLVKAFLQGLSQSVQAMVSDKKTALSVMQSVLRIEDPEALESAYEVLRSNAVPSLIPTEQGIINVLKTMSYEDPAFASIPAFKYFDLSLVEELKTERGQGR